MTRRTMAPAMTKLLVGLVVLAVASSTLAAGEVGTVGFDFELTDNHGVTHMRSDFLGQVLFLAFMGYS